MTYKTYSMSNVNYPYLPEDRTFFFVSADHPHMQAAQQARAEDAGDPIWPNGAVLVRDGEVVARAGNGYNRGSHLIHICPRIVHNCPSGEGYDLCGLHNNPGHAEQMVIDVAREAGIETEGADLYMYGHWWCCKPCWDKMIEAGIANVYLPEGADELFTREKVHAPYLEPTVKNAYLSCGDCEAQRDILEAMKEVCQEIDCEARFSHECDIPNLDNQTHHRERFDSLATIVVDHDVVAVEVSFLSHEVLSELLAAHHHGVQIILLSQKKRKVARFFDHNPAVVYHIEYEDVGQARQMFKNVMIQL